MKLNITRFKEIKDGTIGHFELTSGDKTLLLGYTLEPAGDDTIKPNKDRRIPAGEYKTKMHDSPKFKMRLPLLFNEHVPPDRYILIHAGNYPKDTSGCVLVGANYDKNGVYNSKSTLLRLLALIHNQSLKVIITNKESKNERD